MRLVSLLLILVFSTLLFSSHSGEGLPELGRDSTQTTLEQPHCNDFGSTPVDFSDGGCHQCHFGHCSFVTPSFISVIEYYVEIVSFPAFPDFKLSMLSSTLFRPPAVSSFTLI